MGEDFRSWWLLRREFMEKKGGEVGMSWGGKRHQWLEFVDEGDHSQGRS